jgi:uncharacterized protein YkwD
VHRSLGSRAPAFLATLAIGLLTLVGLLPAATASAATATAAASGCANAGTSPAQNAGAARQATLCLLNRQRSAHGLRPLRSSAPLAQAATAHSRDMVRRRYFDHTAPGNVTFVDRIRHAHYGSRGGWSVGENIAWGSGSLAQPAQIVTGWMNSPGHRANILDGRFRSIGIGIARGVPVSGTGSGATYTTDFGSR